MQQMGKERDQLKCIINLTSNNKNDFKACLQTGEDKWEIGVVGVLKIYVADNILKGKLL